MASRIRKNFSNFGGAGSSITKKPVNDFNIDTDWVLSISDPILSEQSTPDRSVQDVKSKVRFSNNFIFQISSWITFFIYKKPDGFCWKCHKSSKYGMKCTSCPISYHKRCCPNIQSNQKLNVGWSCAECEIIAQNRDNELYAHHFLFIVHILNRFYSFH